MAEFMCCWDRKKSKCVLSQRGCESAVPPIKSQSHRPAATCCGLLHHSPTPAEAAISTHTRNATAVRIKPRRAAEAVPDAGCPRVAAQLLTIRPGLAALHANQASIAARQCRFSHGNMRPARAVRN